MIFFKEFSNYKIIIFVLINNYIILFIDDILSINLLFLLVLILRNILDIFN